MNDNIYVISITYVIDKPKTEQIAVSGYFSTEEQANAYLTDKGWRYLEHGVWELKGEFCYATIETLPCLDFWVESVIDEEYEDGPYRYDDDID